MKYNKHKIDATRDKLNDAIENCVIGHQAQRNRTIIKMHYIDGYTYEVIAETMELSDRHVKKICYDNEPKIIEYLRAD